MSELQTIDLTPTWSGLMPVFLAVIDNLGNKAHLSTQETQSLREAKLNLTKMACLADRLPEALLHLEQMREAYIKDAVLDDEYLETMNNFLNRYDPEQYKKAG